VSFTVAVDTAASFSVCILMSSEKKTDYNTGAAQTTKDGQFKWAVTVAAQTIPVNGQRSTAETISVTITADSDPAAGLPPGTPIEIEDMRVGTMPPERRDEKVFGGKPFFQASGVRPLVAPRASS
jgi:hypothetical protein